MVRPVAPILTRGALAAALAAAMLLSGCGRKGPLELPPSAQATGANSLPETDEGALFGPAATQQRAAPAMNRGGYPIAPPGEKKPLPLDWLID